MENPFQKPLVCLVAELREVECVVSCLSFDDKCMMWAQVWRLRQDEVETSMWTRQLAGNNI